MKRLVVLSGLPGSGKSTYAREREKEGAFVISEDDVRESLFGSIRPYSMEPVFAKMYQEANSYFVNHKDGEAILDSAYLSDFERVIPLQKVKGFDRAELVIFLTPEAVCLERNANREENRRVPSSVMSFLAKSFKMPKKEVTSLYDEVYYLGAR